MWCYEGRDGVIICDLDLLRIFAKVQTVYPEAMVESDAVKNGLTGEVLGTLHNLDTKTKATEWWFKIGPTLREEWRSLLHKIHRVVQATGKTVTQEAVNGDDAYALFMAYR